MRKSSTLQITKTYHHNYLFRKNFRKTILKHFSVNSATVFQIFSQYFYCLRSISNDVNKIISGKLSGTI